MDQERYDRLQPQYAALLDRIVNALKCDVETRTKHQSLLRRLIEDCEQTRADMLGVSRAEATYQHGTVLDVARRIIG